MKRLVYSLVILSILLFACSISTTVTPPVGTNPPVVTESPVVTETPTATEPPVVTANVICNELSLYLDPALASGYDCQTVPESPYEMDLYPEHTELTLQGYPLVDKFFEPHISVYSVAQYEALSPVIVPGFVSSLQALIGGGPAPVFAGFDSPHLPFLPVFNAGQVFFAQYQLLPFVSGGGIRFLAEYGQYVAPVNNNDLFYTYQGLTSDGQYWVSAILPINNPILPANAGNLPFDADMVNQLNAQAAGNYAPTLTILDTLVSSITIQP